MANADKDCTGTCRGAAYLDVCGKCSGGSTRRMGIRVSSQCRSDCLPSRMDCAGLCNGKARPERISTRILGSRTTIFPPFSYFSSRPAWLYPKILVLTQV